MKSPLLLISLLLLTLNFSFAAEFNNHDALQGLTETKAVFDINQGNPNILALRLQLVEETFQQLKTAGTSPKFVLTFRGKASSFLTTGETYIDPEDHEIKKKIETSLQNLSQLGIPLEQCAIAAHLSKIDTGDFLPYVKVVANVYTSMIGYQNQGYALIPME